MTQTKDEGYLIRCTRESDGEVTYLRLSAGRHYLCGMFGPCFRTPYGDLYPVLIIPDESRDDG